MQWIKNLIQRAWGAKPSDDDSNSAPSTTSNIDQQSAQREKELIKKVNRMAKEEKTDPREYLALSPFHRVMLAVKKSEYHGSPKPRTKNIAVHPRYLRKPTVPKPTSRSYPMDKIEQVWRQVPDKDNFSMSKRNCLNQNLDKNFNEPVRHGRNMYSSGINLAVAIRSLERVTSSRRNPTQRKLQRSSKVEQYYNTKRGRSVKRPRAEASNDDDCHVAKKPQCVETQVKRRVFLTRPDPAKDEMRRIREMNRIPPFIFRCGEVCDTFTWISESSHSSGMVQQLDRRNDNNKRFRPEPAEDAIYQVRKKGRYSLKKVVKTVRRWRLETAKETMRSFNRIRVFRYSQKSILTRPNPGFIPDDGKDHRIG